MRFRGQDRFYNILQRQGVIQGCTISMPLFQLVYSALLKPVRARYRLTVAISTLADDTTLLSQTPDHLISAFDDVSEAIQPAGLNMNANKSAAAYFDNPFPPDATQALQARKIPITHGLKLLGSAILPKHPTDDSCNPATRLAHIPPFVENFQEAAERLKLLDDSIIQPLVEYLRVAVCSKPIYVARTTPNILPAARDID